ncbi:MAG: EVE domain-containing protein [Candidatus Omnitrophica bacterium]|nr:EVE domain-containing protein [Candidatus Omnitrophota bacterium]MBU1924129.1 EVE domain-containing protein [Candidatus Omnitrophota bacterium]
MRYWTLSGYAENWERALADNIWGVKENKLKILWEKISNGDILFFYVTSPISGLIGFGKVTAKFKQDKPLWPDEMRANKVIYPYRWEFIPVFVLPKSDWQKQKISLAGSGIGYQAGINAAKNKDAIKALNEKIKQSWKTEIIEMPISEFLQRNSEKKSPNEHARIKNLLIDLGKISSFMVEEEYPIDGQRLDVIWKRIDRGVPTYVFEVQVGGNVTEALGKLKHAYDMWNSNLYLILEEKDQEKAKTLLSGTFHEIKGHLTIILAERMDEFYKIRVANEKMKEELGLP